MTDVALLFTIWWKQQTKKHNKAPAKAVLKTVSQHMTHKQVFYIRKKKECLRVIKPVESGNL